MTPEQIKELQDLRKLLEALINDYNEKMLIIHHHLKLLDGDPPEDLFSRSIYDALNK